VACRPLGGIVQPLHRGCRPHIRPWPTSQLQPLGCSHRLALTPTAVRAMQRPGHIRRPSIGHVRASPDITADIQSHVLSLYPSIFGSNVKTVSHLTIIFSNSHPSFTLLPPYLSSHLLQLIYTFITALLNALLFLKSFFPLGLLLLVIDHFHFLSSMLCSSPNHPSQSQTNPYNHMIFHRLHQSFSTIYFRFIHSLTSLTCVSFDRHDIWRIAYIRAKHFLA
jgi:hypothetical protein